MNALWKAIGSLSGGIPNFPYTIGEEIDTKGSLPSGNNLRLFNGVRSSGDDKTPLTIFQYQKVSELDALTQEGLRNALKKAKAMMLPGCLRCHDATEHNDIIYFATDECLPLNYVLSSDSTRDEFYEDEEKFEHVVALGLDTLATTLQAMHKNNIIHGSLSSESVFVLKNGLWRLFGFEALTTNTSEGAGDSPMYRRISHGMKEHRKAPELTSSSGAVQAPQALDCWGLGCLIYEVFHAVSASTKASDMKSGRNVPRELRSDFIGLIGSSPKLRHSIDKFLQSSFLRENPFVTSVGSLEELNLKDAVEKDRYYRELALQVDNFPLLCCQKMLLPKLATVVQFGGSSATVLEPLLKIGKRLSASDFGASVAPAVVSLCSSQDHLIRCRLLSSAESYAKYLPQSLVCEKIWPQYVSGYQSKNADLRELTIRATVHFAPLLTEELVTSDVVKYITIGQQDPEGPIRTNATVCLSFLAPTLPESIRVKTLTNGFGRMLKDPFTPSRNAAVMSINSGLKEFPASNIASQLMPAVAPLTLDKHKEVRTTAIKCLQNMMKVLEESSATMSDAATEESAATGTTASGSAGHSRTSSTTPAGGAIPPSASSGTVDSTEGALENKSSAGGGSWGWGWGKKGSDSTTAASTTTPDVKHKDPTPADDDDWGDETEGGWGGGSATKTSNQSLTSNSSSTSKPEPLKREGLSSSPSPPSKPTPPTLVSSPTPAATATSSSSSAGTGLKPAGGMKLGLGGGGGAKLSAAKKKGIGGSKLD